jgi:hypothetical protein
VCDQETSENKEAKARYRAVENTSTVGCNARKTNKQTNNLNILTDYQFWNEENFLLFDVWLQWKHNMLNSFNLIVVIV